MTKVSEVIKKLQGLMDKHGDIPVVFDLNYGFYPNVDIDGIDRVSFEPKAAYNATDKRVDAILLTK